jgi:hypothetical protein
MAKFRSGNVIRTKNGSIEIVCDTTDTLTNTVFLNYENASATHREKTYTQKEYCSCGERDCDDCRHNTPRTVVYYGMEDATLVAHTVKEWILKSLTKNFDF